MMLDGYDHIADIVDAEGTPINKVARSRGHFELATLLDNLPEFEVRKIENVYWNLQDLKLICFLIKTEAWVSS